MSGYYLHSRKVFELYMGNPQLLSVCEVILYSVRYNSCVQDGIPVGAGQCLMTLQEIAQTGGVSVNQVRTALRHFVADGGITTENMGRKGILITLEPLFSCEEQRNRAKENKGRNTYSRKNERQKSEPTPDPNASYDLLRAEARAKAHVPKIRKRER